MLLMDNQIQLSQMKRRIRDKYIVLVSLLLLSPLFFLGQNESPWSDPPKLELSGYIDVFYSYDFNEPTTGYRQPFFYNHNRHNEFNINNGNIGLAVNQTKYHAVLTLQAGTYAIDNYAAEPDVLKHIYEAYAGISLNKKNNLWLDAGIFISHLGFESTLSIENYTLTHSMAIENLPYYMSGVKITYSPNKVVTLLGGVYNGWQQIKRTAGSSQPSFGMQVLITPNDNITLNYSNFYGSNDPDSSRRARFFNDFFAEFECFDKLHLIAGFDIGIQQKEKASSEYDTWYALTLIAHYDFTKKWGAALRAEYYQDKNLANISLDKTNYGFETAGFSANIDFRPVKQVACRVEGRWLKSVEDPIFLKNNQPTHNDFFITASIAIKMGKEFSGKKK